MTAATILGFFGDTLTFVGGAVLGWDALMRDREFKEERQSGDVALKDLKGIRLSRTELSSPERTMLSACSSASLCGELLWVRSS